MRQGSCDAPRITGRRYYFAEGKISCACLQFIPGNADHLVENTCRGLSQAYGPTALISIRKLLDRQGIVAKDRPSRLYSICLSQHADLAEPRLCHHCRLGSCALGPGAISGCTSIETTDCPECTTDTPSLTSAMRHLAIVVIVKGVSCPSLTC